MDTLYEMKEAAALSDSDLDELVAKGTPAILAAQRGGIGDITSDAKGSGARFNSGKVPYELLPLHDLMLFLDSANVWMFGLWNYPSPIDRDGVKEILRRLAAFQAGHREGVNAALRQASGLHRSLRAFAPAARVLDYGRKKYAEWNWAKGMPWSVPLGCAVRHCLAILDGEQNDPESGESHIGHVQANLLMLLVFQRTYPEGNDLPWKHLALK